MFIKRKTTAGKVHAYRILLRFKTSLTCIFSLTSQRTTLSVVKQFLSDIIRFFAGHCPTSDVNIQAWLHNMLKKQKKMSLWFWKQSHFCVKRLVPNAIQLIKEYKSVVNSLIKQLKQSGKALHKLHLSITLFEHHAIIYKWDLKTYTMSFVKIRTQPIFLIQDLTK